MNNSKEQKEKIANIRGRVKYFQEKLERGESFTKEENIELDSAIIFLVQAWRETRVAGHKFQQLRTKYETSKAINEKLKARVSKLEKFVVDTLLESRRL